LTDLILTRAAAAVYGDREDDYGHPALDLARTAHMMTGTLRALGWEGPELRSEHVALLMIDVKRSRLMQSPDHEDSAVDLAGWAECHQRIRRSRLIYNACSYASNRMP